MLGEGVWKKQPKFACSKNRERNRCNFQCFCIFACGIGMRKRWNLLILFTLVLCMQCLKTLWIPCYDVTKHCKYQPFGFEYAKTIANSHVLLQCLSKKNIGPVLLICLTLRRRLHVQNHWKSSVFCENWLKRMHWGIAKKLLVFWSAACKTS